MANPCEYSNKSLDFMRDGELLEQLSKRDCAPGSHFNPLTGPPVSLYKNFIQHNNLISIKICFIMYILFL
jgi:hypothetical protein